MINHKAKICLTIEKFAINSLKNFHSCLSHITITPYIIVQNANINSITDRSMVYTYTTYPSRTSMLSLGLGFHFDDLGLGFDLDDLRRGLSHVGFLVILWSRKTNIEQLPHFYEVGRSRLI